MIVSDGQSPALGATNRFLLRSTAPLALDVQPDAGGGAKLTFPALTGGLYIIEANRSLTGPDWEPVATVSNAPAELLEWTVPRSGDFTSRFYRVRWQPVR